MGCRLTRARRASGRSRSSDDKPGGVATPAVVGLRRDDGGWDGTYVHYDGYPEGLGGRVLDLVVDHGGDIAKAFASIAHVAWRAAFDRPLDESWDFETGREGPPLLRDGDAFAREQTAYWYILDPRARTLSIHEYDAAHGWTVTDRATFDAGGHARFETCSDPLDWRNRRRDYGADDPRETAVQLIEAFDRMLPVFGRRMQWIGRVTQEPKAWKDRAPALTDAHLAYPLVLLVSRERQASAAWEPWPEISDIVEGDLLVPRRLLRDTKGCLAVFGACERGIRKRLEEGTMPEVLDFGVLARHFPFGYLDLELDEPARVAAAEDFIADIGYVP